jgi:hypothetical protein
LSGAPDRAGRDGLCFILSTHNTPYLPLRFHVCRAGAGLALGGIGFCRSGAGLALGGIGLCRSDSCYFGFSASLSFSSHVECIHGSTLHFGEIAPQSVRLFPRCYHTRSQRRFESVCGRRGQNEAAQLFKRQMRNCYGWIGDWRSASRHNTAIRRLAPYMRALKHYHRFIKSDPG